MASHYTPHYGLCQWEPGDPFTRAEFNRDNEKLDTALGGMLGKSQILRTEVTEGSIHSFYVDLSDIRWSEWEYVELLFDCPKINYDMSNIKLVCKLINAGEPFLSVTPGPFLLLMMPRHDGTQAVQAVAVGGSANLGIGSISFDQITRLEFIFGTFDYTLPSIKITVRGVK